MDDAGKNKRLSRIFELLKISEYILNMTLFFIILTVAAFAIFSIWDESRIINNAAPDVYEIYKPTEENTLSFEDLHKINPEVIAWIEVYGTNIDYPVMQADNNRKYLNKNVMEQSCLSGAIFLDSGNSSDFNDFNNIIHGHHMAEGMMFGNLDLFVDREFFDSRKYGNLFFDGKDYGLEFFAFIETDAYNWHLFTPGVEKKNEKKDYIDTIYKKSLYSRNIGMTIKDRVVLLETCAPQDTNGRYLLAARLTNEPFPNAFSKDENSRKRSVVDNLFSWMAIPIIAAAIIIIYLLKKKRNGKRTKLKKEKSEMKRLLIKIILTTTAAITGLLINVSSAVAAPGKVTVTIPVNQRIISSDQYSGNGKFTYILTPVTPAGTPNIFTLKGNDIIKNINLEFSDVGIYSYELRENEANPKTGYLYDQTVYQIDVYISAPEGQLIADTIINNPAGDKMETASFVITHTPASTIPLKSINNPQKEENRGRLPGTGDNNNLYIYIALALGSLALLTYLFMDKKVPKEKQNRID